MNRPLDEENLHEMSKGFTTSHHKTLKIYPIIENLLSSHSFEQNHIRVSNSGSDAFLLSRSERNARSVLGLPQRVCSNQAADGFDEQLKVIHRVARSHCLVQIRIEGHLLHVVI